ncbi:MAG: homoserine O-acetyltransferase, partial [Phycisphaerae bacterium]|nr:homoserine O-acetyltransferase [Phycisphaerae bacterium]
MVDVGKNYSGSDEVMGAGKLNCAQTVTFDAPMLLENGGELPNLTVVYETYGKLSPAKDNAIIICHALTGDSHVAAHDENDDPGWWDVVVGPGKSIDTEKFFVICPNVLGGCRGTTGPNSTNPATGKVWGRDFPNITIGDMVDAQNRLIEHLGIEQLLGVVGGSMGGHQAMSWGVKFPDKVRGAVLLATSPRLSTQSLAFDIVGRNSIRHDPNFNGGEFYDGGGRPITGLAIARMLGHITYLSPEAMTEKFEETRDQPRNLATRFEKEFSVGSYLAYKGLKFTERFDANSYL